MLGTELRTRRFVRRLVPLRCSFCGRSEAEVDKLVRGGLAFICDECMAACARIVDESGPGPKGEGPGAG
jgi:ATP-dependent Clp protease ATP-binding subunit ClpX